MDEPLIKKNKSDYNKETISLLLRWFKANETEQDKLNEKPDTFSYIQKIIIFVNYLFICFFNPLKYLFGEEDENVKMLNTEPLFKKFQWIILLTIFAYILYYTFGRFNTGKTNYMESSIWLWIMMFTVLITFIRVKKTEETL
jgi:hypothetical protein